MGYMFGIGRREPTDADRERIDAIADAHGVDFIEVVLPGTSWGTVGLYLVFLLLLSAATALWATWCFRAYERTL